ncbi:MAG TPA: hypothetical protein VGJ00_07640 [Rhabdochlamydiaceae bacterium]|jgi:hypothetical protein
MLKFIFILLTFCFSFTYGYSTLYLKEKFQKAIPGDYIVTIQDTHYSLLILSSLKKDILVLEEISIPEQQVDPKKMNWQNWLRDNAPGHTSWTLYEFDLDQGRLIECFSYSKKGWIYLEQQEQFFAKLFSLPFENVSEADQKKIGPPPSAGESDFRKLWTPPLILGGKKIPHPTFEVFNTRWPEDHSPLSHCFVEVYFDAEHKGFPFPYWIEIKSPHYAFKVRTVESGQGMVSHLAASVPHRPPEILGPIAKSQKVWSLPLRAPLYCQDVQLFACDLSSNAKIAIPHHFERSGGSENVDLRVSVTDLQKLLNPKQRYRWAIFADKTSFVVRSEETFSVMNKDFPKE